MLTRRTLASACGGFIRSSDNAGGATWLNGSYDPDLKLIYWGTGNPNPAYDGDARPGDNLYTDCVVALDADTGRLHWHYQFTPHDVWDFDGVNEMVLVDLSIDSHIVKSLVHADSNGHFFALDRSNGNFLYAKRHDQQYASRRDLRADQGLSHDG
jgi:alcohol dehydrogenase (cytochrome c)